MEKKCPYCGASLHEEASFCPHCAKSINHRVEPHLPRQLSGRTLRVIRILCIVLAATLLLAVWVCTRPKVYDNGSAEVIYSVKDGDYRLFLAGFDDVEPVHVRDIRYEVDYAYRFPLQLYVQDLESGAWITDAFTQNVAGITASVGSSSDIFMNLSCTEHPEWSEYYPNAAAMILFDYTLLASGPHTSEVVCAVTMNNGDIIRLRQQQSYTNKIIYKYTPQDAPMNTIEDLQALIDQVDSYDEAADMICIYLPPVIYEGGPVLKGYSFKLYGSVGADGQRTTFTGPTVVDAGQNAVVCEFSDIDLLGNGQGTGVTASSWFRIFNCRVAGWETGVLAKDIAAFSFFNSTFEDNGVGLHYDSYGSSVMDSVHTNNIFRNNGTALLLEQVPTNSAMSFTDTLFSGNGTDFDNRCNQALELEGAVFE